MHHFTTVVTQKYVVWKVRLSHHVRSFIGSWCHLFFKVIGAELRGRAEHSTIISNATYSPWRVDSPFSTVLKQVASHTLLDKMRLYELWQLIHQVIHIQGNVIEVGCWRGGSGCLLAARIAAADVHNTTIFLCDTFQGIVKAGCHDEFYQGQELADSSKMVVVDLAKRLSVKNVTILSGVFPEQTGRQIEDCLFKFAHIDVDVYQSARDAFEWLLPRLVDGAIVVFDDYGFASTPGIRRYIDELQGQPDLVIIRNINGQAVVIKR